MNHIKLLFIFLIFIPYKSYSQNITVGNGGDYPTLSQAASSLNPGDVVVILNQVFSDGTQYLTNINGLPNQPITIVAETNQGPVFRGGSEAIHLSNCNHIIIDGLVFEQQTENSLNIDDGTNYATPSTNITVRNCVFRDIGANGNHDFLKMSGVDDFLVTNCTFTNGDNSGLGSGLDMVGCHQGLIQDCIFDAPGSIGVSGKGGTRYVTIEKNVFKNTRGRAVAVGGYSDLPFFRPPLPNPIVNAFEASDVNVFSNVFMNNDAPIAFVGAVNSTFRNNTIYKPQNWVIRILQENTVAGFLPCSNNEFSNNIIYLQNDLVEVNIAPNTNPGSFTFSHNGWYNETSSNWSPDLPATSQNRLIANPLFVNAANEDFRLNNQSPFIGNGASYATPTTDFDQTPYSNPRSRGAFEGGESPTCPPAGEICNDDNPNTENDVEDGFCNCAGTPINPPSGECELLTNTNFDNSTDPWIYWGANDVSVVNGVVNIRDIESSTQPWGVGFIQSNIPVENGENYTIRFRARADGNRPLNVRVEESGGNYTEYYQTNVYLTPIMDNYVLNFTMTKPTDNNANFIFYMGENTISTYIDNVSLTKDDCGTSCPQQGQNCDDENPCTTGETYDANCNCNGGTFQDSDNDGVCDAFDACPGTNDAIIGTICSDGDDCTTGETYDSNCNCTGGTSQDADGDNVCAALDPDDNDPCVPNSCEETECELLTNTDFDNNTDPWIYWGANDVSVVDGVVNIRDIESSTQPWGVGFIQSNIPVENGENYTIRFRARADGNRPLNVRVEQSGGDYTEYYQTNVNLTPIMDNYVFNFTMTKPTDNNANFIFYMGGNTISTYIDNVSLTKDDCGTSCPQQGQNCDDEDPCTTGETYDANCNCNGGTFQDSDNDGVCDAFDACPGTNDALIGTTCSDGDDCTTGETYDNNCNCTGGTSQDADNDGVCAALDPNDNDPCVPNVSNCDGGECELLTNTNFNNGLAPWGYWDCNAASVNGMARLTNIINGQNVWDAALYTDNILIEQGAAYEVKFRARASSNRTMDVKVGQNDYPWDDYLYETVNLTTSMKDFNLSFTMNAPTDNNTAFDFFIAGGNTANIYIENVSLKKINCDTPPPTSGQCDCPDAAEPGNTRTVRNVSELRNALNQANNQGGNMTIKLEPGEYQLDYTLVIKPNMSNLTIMGTTGNRDDVFIKGLGAYNSAVGAVLLVQASDFTIAHLTIGESSTHAVQLQGERDADNFTAINVNFVDTYEQILKVSMGPNSYSDNGRVLCSAFEFTAGEAYNDYTRAIDALKCKNWIVSNNVIKGIRSPNNEITEHAILFWRASEGTIVTNNRIMNCDRGIGFGLVSNNGIEDGHIGGLIMNNFVHTNRDVGIGIEHSPNTKIYNNTVITENYSNSIEYRFPATTNVQIANNLTSANITKREGASAITPDNYVVSNLNIFVDAANYDYHLAGTPSGIVDAGTPLSEVNVDIDCDNRNGGIDIGADQVTGAAKEDESFASSFTLYPNPANHSIQLDCEISENTQAQIHLYDNLGQLVKNMTNIELHEGIQTLNVDVSDLPAGVYFCALQSDEWQTVKKFVIAR